MKIHMYMSLDEFANLKEGNVCIGYSKGVLQSHRSIHVEVPTENVEKIEQMEHGLLYTVNPTLSVIHCEGLGVTEPTNRSVVGWRYRTEVEKEMQSFLEEQEFVTNMLREKVSEHDTKARVYSFAMDVIERHGITEQSKIKVLNYIDMTDLSFTDRKALQEKIKKLWG